MEQGGNSRGKRCLGLQLSLGPWIAAVPGAVGDHGQLSLGLWVTWPPEALETGMSLQTLLWLWNLVPKGRVWARDEQRGFGESKAV